MKRRKIMRKIITNTQQGVLSVTMKGYGFVNVENQDADIFVAKEDLNGAIDGDTVIIRYNKKKKAEVINVVSHTTETLDMSAIMKKYNLNEDFSDTVINEAKIVTKTPSDETIKSRLDLRKSKNIITIDPADAKDLDDAISLDVNPDGTQTLGIHIADVSHYVREGSELDKEAFRRGTSVYFPDKVFPMLPPQLSNNICSLNPNEPRLALSVLITLDKNDNIMKHKITKTVISSVTKFSYDEVQAILDGAPGKHKDMLLRMAKLAVKYEKERNERGEVAFEIPEPKILLDEDGKIKDVIVYPHKLSHRIIETFMILANEIVAKHIFDLDFPFVYRVHEKPDPLKVSRFLNIIKPFGIIGSISPENPTGKSYQKLLDSITDENVKVIISSLALRSMQKAKYSPDCIGHFGLGSKYYCHFTSPIRRYPDLLIHRIIKFMLDNKLSSHKIEQLKPFCEEASEQSSRTEISAMEAEREFVNMKCAEFMYEHIGGTFNGIVKSITEFGIFVYLPENTAEGLCRIENLPLLNGYNENYKYNDDTMQMVGKHSKIRMGDPMKVTVIDVNLRKAKIEFSALYS
jgi:ribonuclease R